MDINWTEQLVDQLDWHWNAQLRPRLEGLSDDEYLWEPVANCWSARARDEARTPTFAGAGDLVLEYEFPTPHPVPVTTIAWRLAHITVAVFGARSASHFGGPEASYETFDYSETAAGSLKQLDAAYDDWISGVRTLDDEGLARPCGPAEGPFAEYPMAALVLHINREALHHGAEISLLRDLYINRTD